MKKLLILFVMLCGLFSSAQYTVIHVNSSWNTRHNVDLSGLKNAKVKYILLEDQTPSFKQQVKSVPTILVLDKNGRTKGQWKGGIALKLDITREDIQEHINKLIALENK
jgi:hypothetical protein